MRILIVSSLVIVGCAFAQQAQACSPGMPLTLTGTLGTTGADKGEWAGQVQKGSNACVSWLAGKGKMPGGCATEKKFSASGKLEANGRTKEDKSYNLRVDKISCS